MSFVKSKKYCRFWKACGSFKRSECESEIMDVERCYRYTQLESEENLKQLKGAIRKLRRI